MRIVFLIVRLFIFIQFLMITYVMLPGIGPKTQQKLQKLGIATPRDLLYHFPFRYLDFSRIQKIRELRVNSSATITGKIIKFQNIYTKTHKNLQIATVADSTGTIDLVWFNQPYLSSIFKPQSTFSFAGQVTFFSRKIAIFSPEYGQYHTGKIIAVYPETKNLSSRWFRKNIQSNLSLLTRDINETLPPQILSRYHLPKLKQALLQIHSPDNNHQLSLARLRLALDEILSLQVQSHLQRLDWSSKTPNKTFQPQKQITQFIKSLPFTLTPAQKRVWAEIEKDLLSSTQATNRLLQGDVGSGKTVVATLACYLSSLNNSLSLFLVPTDILARQHHQTLSIFFKKTKVPIHLLTATSKINFEKIPSNSIIVSTHAALYQKSKLINRLGLLIIDEQHKFGVNQRTSLSSILHPPHCLTMTATPIPRSISLTALGNLDLSIIDTLPKNRLPVKTFLVPQNKKNDCYHWIEKQIRDTNCQAFVVCPFIDESETLQSIKAATVEFDTLSHQIFPDLKLALIHGKTKVKTRQKTIDQFQHNHLHILVTTPIIEVGIDIPNATIMLIQSADRFGLAQLHQLRGRVGRGSAQSYCYLFTETDNDKALNRLKFLEKNHHGLKIAEYDLKTRGPGEAFSTLQHGFPSLKLANLSDLKLITFSQKILNDILTNHPSYNLHSLIHSSPSPTSSITN